MMMMTMYCCPVDLSIYSFSFLFSSKADKDHLCILWSGSLVLSSVCRSHHLQAMHRHGPLLAMFVCLSVCLLGTWVRCGKIKGKVLPYLLASVGPGADPGVQAVSSQVT